MLLGCCYWKKHQIVCIEKDHPIALKNKQSWVGFFCKTSHQNKHFVKNKLFNYITLSSTLKTRRTLGEIHLYSTHFILIIVIVIFIFSPKVGRDLKVILGKRLSPSRSPQRLFHPPRPFHRRRHLVRQQLFLKTRQYYRQRLFWNLRNIL